MRPPVESERDAFRAAIGAAAVIALAILLGWLTNPWVGVVFAVVAAIAAVVAYVVVGRRDRTPTLRQAAHAARPLSARPGTRHVLVIANETLAGSELRERILAGDGEPVEIDVLAPVLTSRLHLGVTDIDRELEQARRRLARSLRWANEQGIPARGRIGDANITASIEDELRSFGADEVIVVTHASDRETWQERGEVARLQRELDVPVSHLTAS